MSLIESLASAATAGAAIWAALIASRGLRTWRAQLVETAHYDVARRTLRGVLVVRERIADVRAPFVSVGEIWSAFNSAGIDPKAVTIPGDERQEQVVFQARWVPLVTAMRDLEGEIVEAEVVIGAEARKPHEELRSLVNRLRFAVDHHIRQHSKREQWRWDERSTDTEQGKILWAGSDPDSFSDEVQRVVKLFEDLLRPHLATTVARRPAQ